MQPKQYAEELKQKTIQAIFNANGAREIREAKKLMEFCLRVEDAAGFDRKPFRKSFTLLSRVDDSQVTHRRLSYGWNKGEPKVSVTHSKKPRGKKFSNYTGVYDKATGQKMVQAK